MWIFSLTKLVHVECLVVVNFTSKIKIFYANSLPIALTLKCSQWRCQQVLVFLLNVDFLCIEEKKHV